MTFIAVDNIEDVIARDELIPTVVLWNRLEGRPRTANFQRALRAEVRDPLWMLCKQWQVGEFKGDDAGSPIFAKIHMETAAITRYQAGARDPQPFDARTPLEAVVERRPIPFFGQDQILSLDIRLSMGRQWTKLLASEGLGSLSAGFVAQYPIQEPDPELRADAELTAHPATWQTVSAFAGRAMDGAGLYLHLVADSTHRAYDDITTIPVGDRPAIDALAEKFVTWYETLYHQPNGTPNDAWQPNRLEYQFAVSAPVDGAEKTLVADEFHHGHLDWYSLDSDPTHPGLDDGAGSASPDTLTRSFIPTALQFEGMPNTRWWTFEDGKTNFGDIHPDTTDINKLLLIEFALVYANDWFLIPVQLPVGSLANIRGLAVTNVFGERTWVTASGSGADEDWQRWAMFNPAVKGTDDVRADTTMILLPTVPKISEGKPFDDVRLIRDEVSNMVWGVEQRVPLASGRSKPGREAGREMASRFEYILNAEIEGGLVVPEIPDPAAAIRYQLMQGVPENWIPFLPVHMAADNHEIQLQRAAMPRVIAGDPGQPEKVKPRSALLRQGLDKTPAQPYFLYEEEVPRAGVRVTQSFQRTRWHDGRAITWVGVRKQTGRGEGSSGLAFDRVKPTE